MRRRACSRASRAVVGSLKTSASRNRPLSKMILKIQLPLSTKCPRILTSYSTKPPTSKIATNLSTEGISRWSKTPRASQSPELNLWVAQSVAKRWTIGSFSDTSAASSNTLNNIQILSMTIVSRQTLTSLIIKINAKTRQSTLWNWIEWMVWVLIVVITRQLKLAWRDLLASKLALSSKTSVNNSMQSQIAVPATITNESSSEAAMLISSWEALKRFLSTRIRNLFPLGLITVVKGNCRLQTDFDVFLKPGCHAYEACRLPVRPV